MKKVKCPVCDERGLKVKIITLESVLRIKFVSRIRDVEYYFCETPNCDIVYYSEGKDHIFGKNTLLVKVGIKEESTPKPICYCFNHNVEGIENEIQNTGKSTVSDDIAERLQDGCWCDTRNPAGRCCLGSVRKVEKELLQKYGTTQMSTCKGQNTLYRKTDQVLIQSRFK